MEPLEINSPDILQPNPNQIENIVYSIQHNNSKYIQTPRSVQSQEMNEYFAQVSAGLIGRGTYEVFLRSIVRRQNHDNPEILFNEMNNPVAHQATDIRHMRG